MNPCGNRDEQAAFWFLKLQEPDASVEEIDAALDWIEASDDNRRAFDRVQCCWHAGNPAAVSAPSAPAASNAALAWRALLTRTLWAAAVLLVVAAGMGIHKGSFRSDAHQLERYATAVGEIRRIELLDGSEMTLGGASSVAVDYRAEMRRVVLADGEVLLKVAKEPERPFVVEAGGGYARALGTVFSVRRGTEGVTVGVAEGLVEVGLSETDAVPARLPLGREVTYSASAGIGPVRAINPTRVGAWSRGVLTFIDRPLAAVVVDINRYSPRLVVIDGERLKSLRVTGTVGVQGIGEWLGALQSVAALELDDSGPDWVLRQADVQR